jgi:hypothetical protein
MTRPKPATGRRTFPRALRPVELGRRRAVLPRALTLLFTTLCLLAGARRG